MYATSYNGDFQWPEQTGWGIKKWLREKDLQSEEIKSSVPIYRNQETLTHLTKDCVIPFNYLLRPKPIVGTNPLLPFHNPEIPKDDGTARLTRPRVYKAPEISLDDIEDLKIRDKIIDFTYSTTWGLASKEAEERVTKREIPNSTWEPPHHVQFRKEEDCEKLVCEDDSVTHKLNEWDSKQSKAVGDSTTAFWQHYRNNNTVKLIDKYAADIKSPEVTNRILSLAKENKLCFPYTLRPTNYTGYMPSCPIGMEPVKQDLEFSDPNITTNQLANRWCKH